MSKLQVIELLDVRELLVHNHRHGVNQKSAVFSLRWQIKCIWWWLDYGIHQVISWGYISMRMTWLEHHINTQIFAVDILDVLSNLVVESYFRLLRHKIINNIFNILLYLEILVIRGPLNGSHLNPSHGLFMSQLLNCVNRWITNWNSHDGIQTSSITSTNNEACEWPKQIY